MVEVELVLVVACLAGLLGMVAGWVLRSRRVHNEHWLWKKRRLWRARLLLRGGGAVCLVSGVAMVVA